MSRAVPSFPLILMLLPTVGAQLLMTLSISLWWVRSSSLRFSSFASRLAHAKSCAIGASFSRISRMMASTVAIFAWAAVRALIGVCAGLLRSWILPLFHSLFFLHSWTRSGSAPWAPRWSMSLVCSIAAQFPACRMVLALEIAFTFHSRPVCTCSLSHSFPLILVVIVICVMCDFSCHVQFFLPVALDLYSWTILLMVGFPVPNRFLCIVLFLDPYFRVGT